MLRFHLEFACHWQLEVLLVEKHAGSLNKLGWGAEKKSRSKKRCRRRTDGTLMWHNDLEMRAKQGMRAGSTVFLPHPKETVMLEQKNNHFFCFLRKFLFYATSSEVNWGYTEDLIVGKKNTINFGVKSTVFFFVSLRSCFNFVLQVSLQALKSNWHTRCLILLPNS